MVLQEHRGSEYSPTHSSLLRRKTKFSENLVRDEDVRLKHVYFKQKSSVIVATEDTSYFL